MIGIKNKKVSTQESWKDFFKITTGKIIISIAIIFYIVWTFLIGFYGPIYSITPFFLFYPLKFFGKLIILLIIPYIYLISCLFFLYSKLHILKKH